MAGKSSQNAPLLNPANASSAPVTLSFPSLEVVQRPVHDVDGLRAQEHGQHAGRAEAQVARPRHAGGHGAKNN